VEQQLQKLTGPHGSAPVLVGATLPLQQERVQPSEAGAEIA